MEVSVWDSRNTCRLTRARGRVDEARNDGRDAETTSRRRARSRDATALGPRSRSRRYRACASERTSLEAAALTTLRVRRGATAGRPEARRSCFTEDLAAMPPTREASAALGVARAAFIARAFDGNGVNDEVRDAKSRVESDAASDEGCCAEKCDAHVRA